MLFQMLRSCEVAHVSEELLGGQVAERIFDAIVGEICLAGGIEGMGTIDIQRFDVSIQVDMS